jgi:hypothetical protein
LNNQQTKEELQTEYLAYMEVRNADLIVLQERQTNMAVSAFILVFSACPDAPSAASMLQAITHPNRTAVHDVQTCVNATGGKTVHFGHKQIESKAQELSDEAQDMLMRFISSEEHKKGGRRAAEAAEKLEPMAMAYTESIDEDLDDGDVDDAGNDDEQDEEDRQKMFQMDTDQAFVQRAKQTQDPCGPPVDRVEIPDKKPCSKMPASCCSCNKYFTNVKGHGNTELGWCNYVPEKRKCQGGNWLKKHPDAIVEQVCGLKKEEQPVEKPKKSELKAANMCSNAKFDCGILHDMFAALWGETKDLVDSLVWKMNQDTAAWEKVKGDINMEKFIYSRKPLKSNSMEPIY